MSKIAAAADPRVTEAVENLETRGYTVFEKLYNDAEVDALRAVLTELWEKTGRLGTYAKDPDRSHEGIEISTTGLVLYKLLKWRPELASALVRREVRDTLYGYLGSDMHLELVGGVLSDRSRPFFDWHHHIGGIDDELYRKTGKEALFERPQRVTALLYLDDIDEAGGQLMVLPRRITDSVQPPAPVDQLHWEGEVAVKVPRGSVVVFEQCLYHSVRRRTADGTRMFIGCYYASAEAPPTEGVDESLVQIDGAGELFESVRPGRTSGR